VISRLSCPECKTSIEGTFGHGLFSDLADEERHFVELFVVARGNIKEMEKRLGVSYPTVRNRLDSIIKKLNRKLTRDDPGKAAGCGGWISSSRSSEAIYHRTKAPR